MKTSVERIDSNTVKLTVTSTPDEVKSSLDKAYKQIATKVRIPGFRKGHVPQPVIDNYVGKDVVLAEATEAIVQDTYTQAVDAEELRTIEAPDMGELETIVPGEEYTWSAEVLVRPELTLSSYDDIKVTVPSDVVTDEEVETQIDNFRERFATLEPVEDRGVEPKDFVLVSFTSTIGGEGYEGNVVDKYLYEMGQGLMPVEFDEGLLGTMPGGETRAEFVVPETSSVAEYVGKIAAWDITVHEIKAKVLPAADDEFAANVGGFDSIDDLRDNIRERMTAEKSVAAGRAKERAARVELAKRLEGDIPKPMITKRADAMGRDFIAGLEQRGTTIEEYQKATGVDGAQLNADILEEAEESIREDLSVEALFRALGLELTDEDVDEEIALFAEASKTSPEEAREKWTEMGLMPVLREQAMQRRATLWLLDHVEVEVEGGEPSTGTKKSSAKSKSGAAKKADEAPAEEPQTDAAGETSEE